MAQESHPDGGSAKHPGLRLTESGKWGVQIYHPIQRKMKWFGTYNTIEEANNVYEKNRLEIALQLELANATKRLDVDCNLERANNTPPVCAKDSQSDCKSYKGVREKRPGRWTAEIKIPFKRKSVYLGTFNTPEEAADAYAKKRREFDDTMTALGKKQKCRGGAGENSDSTAALVSSQDSQGSHTKNVGHKKLVVDANCAEGSQTCCASYKGVRQRRSGRWTAEIKDPFKRKSVYLGCFNNPEEAADAFAKKRCEFDDAFAERRREFDDALMALGKKQQRKGQAAENSNSTVSSQNSQGNNCTEHAEDEFGVGVINSYGQLIGEYSRIDDDLWLTGL